MRVWTSWDSIHYADYKLKQRKEHQFISVVVIGRNEEDRIADCLSSIAKNNYPKDKFEIIFVDDHSEDDTVNEAKKLNRDQLQVLHLSDYSQLGKTQSFKKAGIRYAVSQAKGELIVCTDADCIVNKDWLAYIDFGMQQALIKMLVMPISFIQKKSIINRFQSLDMMATMAFTGYGIYSKHFYSANGANIAFRKTIYNQVDIREEYASGDDMFLVQEVARAFPEGVKFLKSTKVLVKTIAESSWPELLQQRKRWATKSKGYSNNNLYKTQTYIFVFNALMILNIILGLSIHSLFLFTAAFQFLIKGIMDYLLLENMSQFFQQRKALKLFIISFGLFTPYILYMGLSAFFGKRYTWKGREVS